MMPGGLRGLPFALAAAAALRRVDPGEADVNANVLPQPDPGANLQRVTVDDAQYLGGKGPRQDLPSRGGRVY